MLSHRAHRETPGSSTTPTGGSALPGTERPLALVRAFAAILLVATLSVHRADAPVLAVAAAAILAACASTALVGGVRDRLAPRLLRPGVAFAADAAAAYLLATAYPAPDALSWLGFVLLIVSGALRWTLNGAVLGFALYLTAELPGAVHPAAGAAAAGVIGIRVGIIGLAAVVVGLVAQMAAQFRALQARTAALDESRSALTGIVDTSPAAVVTVDPAGVITGWSRRAEEVFGWAAGDAVGRLVDDVLHLTTAGDGAAVAQPWRVPAAACDAVEAAARRRDGSSLPVEVTVSPALPTAEGLRHAVFLSDVTARRRVEQLREMQAAVLRVFAESSSLRGGLERFLQVMCRSTACEAAHLWSVDAATNTLRREAAWSQSQGDAALQALAGEVEVPVAGSLPHRAWQERSPLLGDAAAEPHAQRRTALQRAGISSLLAVPVTGDGGVIGVVELLSRGAIDLDSRYDALAQVGTQLAMFVEQRREEAAHRDTAVRLQSLLDSVGDGIITFDEGGAIESANRAAGALFDRPAEQLTRMNVAMLLAPEHRDGFTARLERGAVQWETEGLRRDGSVFPMEFRASAMRVRHARLFTATLRDMSELTARTLALQHQALHDNLTGLPNRTLLGDRLGQAIAAATRAKHQVALLLMDMDGFKEVNDSLGHHSGDMLLRQLATRLRTTLREEDTVARLGGDEFAVLPAGHCDEETAMRLADKVLAALQAPFLIEEQSIHARVSIGVAVFPGHGDDAETLLRRADVAMYTAKRMRSGQVAYSPAQDEHSKRRLQLTGELRRAIPASELLLHYQPRLHIPTGEVNALEALVRWQHPQHGLVPPSEFIPVAEQSDLIHPLTAWVAGEAVRQLRGFSEVGLDLSVAINISARNLEDQQLPLMMAGLLRAHGVGAAKLRLEMTETVVMASDWQQVLGQLHALGLSVSIDDFGVGYSSLAYLQRLPVDEIKIDKSFVVDMVDNPDNAAIVRSTIDLGHNLGLRVVAEGVETDECLQMLRRYGCDVAQGYLVSPPLNAPDLVEFFAERRQRARRVGASA